MLELEVWNPMALLLLPLITIIIIVIIIIIREAEFPKNLPFSPICAGRAKASSAPPEGPSDAGECLAQVGGPLFRPGPGGGFVLTVYLYIKYLCIYIYIYIVVLHSNI